MHMFINFICGGGGGGGGVYVTIIVNPIKSIIFCYNKLSHLRLLHILRVILKEAAKIREIHLVQFAIFPNKQTQMYVVKAITATHVKHR